MDGQHPLPDQDPRKGQDRDEPAGAGLQYEANDQDLRRQPADAGDCGLTAPACRREPPLAVAQHPHRKSCFHTTSVESGPLDWALTPKSDVPGIYRSSDDLLLATNPALRKIYLLQ